MGSSLSFPEVEINPERTYLITGGNTGIGYVTAKEIARLGGHVIIACRNMTKANDAVKSMQEEYEAGFKARNTEEEEEEEEEEEKPRKLNIEVMEVDLASFASTKRFIDEFKARNCPLNVLICNAGISLQQKEITEDGNELMFQTNFLSHLLITLHFLPILQSSGEDSRLINVSSMAHSLTNLDMDNLQGEKSYGNIKCYANSKLYQIMSMFWFSRHLKDTTVSIFSVHPGIISTQLSTQNYFLKYLVMAFAYNTKNGAASSLKAALDSDLKGKTDVYISKTSIENPSAFSRNTEKQEELMKYSLNLIKNYLPENLDEYLNF